jgi:hypothetical protein
MVLTATAIAAVAAVLFWLGPFTALRVAAGVVAHDVCGRVFVTRQKAEEAIAEMLDRPGIARLAPVTRVGVDAAGVGVSVAGFALARAVDASPHGCRLVHGAGPTTAPARVASPTPRGLDAGIRTDARFSKLLDAAFAETPGAAPRRTKAVVILHEGRIVAERYAAGVDAGTLLHGFSLTKTVMNALTGILVRQGRLDPDAPAPIPAWRAAGDPRGTITVEQLLRMTTGLALDEENSGFDPSSRLIYLERDLAAAAALARPIAPPGTRYAYSSPTTLLLSRVVADRIGGGQDAVAAFMRRELFEPLGMGAVTFEFDAAGTPRGDAYMFASARDWARIGELFLRDGIAAGRRLLPEGWVKRSATPHPAGYYGAGLWSAAGDHAWAKQWRAMGIPREAFFATGNLGQRIVVLPAQNAVVVRLASAVDPAGDMPGMAALVRGVIAALRS